MIHWILIFEVILTFYFEQPYQEAQLYHAFHYVKDRIKRADVISLGILVK